MRLMGLNFIGVETVSLARSCESWVRQELALLVAVSLFFQHCKALRACGFSEEQIAAIPHWSATDLFSDIERAVLAYTDDLVLGGGRSSDGVFSILKEHLSDEAILELTYITCMYEMHATMTRALRLEFDDVDERITEVPLPDGEKKDIDFMRVIERQD